MRLLTALSFAVFSFALTACGAKKPPTAPAAAPPANSESAAPAPDSTPTPPKKESKKTDSSDPCEGGQ